MAHSISDTAMQAGQPARSQARAELWRQRLEAWRASGFSQSEYCRQHDLTLANFSNWKRRLIQSDSTSLKNSVPTPATFIPVKLEQPGGVDSNGGSGSISTHDSSTVDHFFDCELLLKNGRRLRIGSRVAAQRVAELASALEATASC